MILDDIVIYKRKLVEEEKLITPINSILSYLDTCAVPRDFAKHLKRNDGLSIIAEVKKASPSKGIIRKDFDPLLIAEIYQANNADAISVLTEDKYFYGKNSYLTEIKSITSIPILRKDFIIDPYQIYQSRIIGADAILLIASILTKRELKSFIKTAHEIGLQCLVEVHNKEQLEDALSINAEIIGINNRNLKTFETSVTVTESLAPYVPYDRVLISESGIKNVTDMQLLKSLGVDGVLIGEAFMRSNSIKEMLEELRRY